MTSDPSPPADPGPDPGRRGLDGAWEWLRRLGVARDEENRWMAGVASGLATRFAVDPVLVRAGFVLLAVFGGLGVPLYLLAWALLPDARGSIVAERAVRQRDRRSTVIVVVVAVIVLSSLSGRWWFWVGVPVAAAVLWGRRSRSVDPPGRSDRGLVPPWTPPLAAPPVSPPYGAQPVLPPYGVLPPVVPPPSFSEPGATGAPYGMGPGRTGTVRTTAPETHRRAERRRAGVLGLLLAVGLGLAGAAIASEVLDSLRATKSVPAGLGQTPFTLACALAGVGLALTVIGLLGRRAGFTGLLALGLAAATIATVTAPPFVFATGTEDRTWYASQPAPAEGYVVGLGDGRLDLTGAEPDQQFDVKVGLGDLTIVVPPGVKAVIEPTLDLGDLSIVRDGGSQTVKPEPSLTVGDGPTTVTVKATLLSGDLTVDHLTSPATTTPGASR